MRQAEYQQLLNTYNQRVTAANAAAAQTSQQQQQQQQDQQQQQQQPQSNPMAGMAQMLPMMMMGGGQQQPQGQVAAPTGQLAAPNSDTGFGGNVASSVDAAQQQVQQNLAQPSAATLNRAVAAAPAAGDAASQRVATLPEQIQPAGAEVAREANDPQTGPAAPTPEITMASETLTGDFKSQMQQLSQQASANFKQVDFFQTMNAIGPQKTEPIVKEFEAAKKQCTENAERTEKLCVEGTSPGAQAVRAMMDVAGPMMALMNAQKSCSSTSKVADLAGLGLTAANGVCIASKMKCESLCKTATEVLKKSKEKLLTEFQSAFEADKALVTACAQNPQDPRAVECQQKLRAATPYGPKTKQTASTLLDKQVDPATHGTPNAMQAKCDNKIRNIIGMMANIAALALSKKGADDCAKKLEAAGGAASTQTAQQYCEQSANSGTQFCRCQNNSSAEGCPSSLIAAPGTEGGSGTNPNDVAGANIRPNSGLSNFAGFKGGGVPTGGANLSLGGSGAGEGGDTSSPFGAASPGAAALNTAAAGGGPGAGAGGSAAAEAAAKKAKEDDDKKWSFGAMAAGVGSMFGGGKGGNTGNGDLKNANSALEANIQRKIASDRLGMEVTPASGISNWDKVHKTIIRVENTLMRGN
jgi:hypothetical protein